MISMLLGLVVLVLQIISFALLIYCVMSFVMPTSSIMEKTRRYVEPILTPFRELLYRFIPKLKGLVVDVSPLAVWLVIEVAIWLINLLRSVF